LCRKRKKRGPEKCQDEISLPLSRVISPPEENASSSVSSTECCKDIYNYVSKEFGEEKKKEL